MHDTSCPNNSNPQSLNPVVFLEDLCKRPVLKPSSPQVSEGAALPRAIAIIRQAENRSDGSGRPCLDLLVDLKLGSEDPKTRAQKPDQHVIPPSLAWDLFLFDFPYILWNPGSADGSWLGRGLRRCVLARVVTGPQPLRNSALQHQVWGL